MYTTVRKAEEKDLNSVYNFEKAYMEKFEQEHLEKWLNAKEKTMSFLKSHMDDMFIAVSETDDIMGFAYWAMHENDPCVFSIYVDPQYRKKKIGHSLMIATEEDILKKGYNKVTLSTRTINPAQYLFNKLQYNELKRDTEWIYYDKTLS